MPPGQQPVLPGPRSPGLADCIGKSRHAIPLEAVETASAITHPCAGPRPGGRFPFVADRAVSARLPLRHSAKPKEKYHGPSGEIASQLELRGSSLVCQGSAAICVLWWFGRMTVGLA
jgi:hypothetical protein